MNNLWRINGYCSFVDGFIKCKETLFISKLFQHLVENPRSMSRAKLLNLGPWSSNCSQIKYKKADQKDVSY